MTINPTDPILLTKTKPASILRRSAGRRAHIAPIVARLREIYRLHGKSHRAWVSIHCNSCEQAFTVTVGSVMERSHVPLNKWVLAYRLICSSKKGMSAHQLHRMLDVTYKTAWFMAHRIRESMTDAAASPIGGANKVIEADETYVGGKARTEPTSQNPRGTSS